MSNDYTVNDLFDSSSPNYNGALRFSTPPPAAQMSGLDGVSPATLSAGEIQGNTTVSDGYLQSENYVPATTGWRLTPTSGDINFSLSVQQIVLGTSGYIRGGQTDYNTGTGFFLGYSGAAYKFSIGTPTGGYLTWNGTTLDISGTQNISKYFTAGHDLTVGDAVFTAVAGDGTNTTITQSTGGSDYKVGSTSTAQAAKAQTFLTDANTYYISTVKLSLKRTSGLGSGNLTVYILKGDLTGGALGATDTSVACSSLTSSFADYTFTVNTPVEPNTTYAFYIGAPLLAANTDIYADSANNPYANGVAYHYDSGALTWTSDTPTDFVFTITEKRTLAGRVYKTSALTTGLSDPFIGFVKTTTSEGSQVPVIISGTVSGLSSLTVGSKYYIADVRGTIATSAGTVTRKCGIAVSTTELLVTNIW